MELINLNIDEFYIEQLEKLYNDTQTDKHDTLCDCNDEIIIVDGFLTCINCGIVNMNKINFVHDILLNKLHLFYKRKHYFCELLKNFQGQIEPKLSDDDYINIREVSDNNPNNVKKALKQLNMQKHIEKSNYIKWKIWKIELPYITNNQYQELLKLFLRLEYNFRTRRIRLNKKKFFSYNLVLKILFNKIGLYNYSKMISPLKSVQKTKKQYELINSLLN